VNIPNQGCCKASERDKCGICGGTGDCCVPDCQNGGFCDLGVCNCRDSGGYSGPTCEAFDCTTQPCLNGGICIGPNKCDCSQLVGWTGDNCGTYLCYSVSGNFTCYNGGTCITSNRTCACSTGYLPPFCAVPICTQSCLNGGICSAPDLCDCRQTAFEGPLCDVPKCNPPCQNGGSCSAPDTCDCPKTYDGDVCQDHVQNGQTSLYQVPVWSLTGLVLLLALLQIK